ncbi:ECs_2282 family putative zinc-binding protein [Candidatus Thiothrix anitrata]|uniref:Uncharacterized protein n=1 Tax=Candidatus Thiothrix anitrata TaxID=2823902 RepID=A0ABX7X9J0_9GAMM|nr:hypothetical protein [Candidatus Thiothrix anitrata]QTR51884.1 hypothetical protein J8380_11820 [Candidatus Thiothrix anitrata]
MDTEKYNRSITLFCPTCGNSQFSPVSSDDINSELQKCASCGREITRDELIKENSENIEEHAKEIKEEITRDITAKLKKRLSSMFK